MDPYPTIEQPELVSKRNKARPISSPDNRRLPNHPSYLGQNLQLSPNLPILFIYGSIDETCPSTYVARMSSLSQNLTTIRLEGVGHWVLLEAPGRTIEEVLQFANRLAAGPRPDIKRASRL